MPVAATKSCWKQFRVSFSTLELASFSVLFCTLFAVSFTGRHSLKQTSTAAVICNITNAVILIIPTIILIINIMMTMMNSNSMRKQTIEVRLLWMLLLCVVLYSRVAQMKSKFSLWLTLPYPKLCQVSPESEMENGKRNAMARCPIVLQCNFLYDFTGKKSCVRKIES